MALNIPGLLGGLGTGIQNGFQNANQGVNNYFSGQGGPAGYDPKDVADARNQSLAQMAALFLAGAQPMSGAQRAQYIAQVPMVGDDYRKNLRGMRDDRREESSYNQAVQFQKDVMANPDQFGFNPDQAKLFGTFKDPVKAMDAYTEIQTQRLFPAQKDDFNLSAGQVRYDGDGNVIATGPAKEAYRTLSAEEAKGLGLPPGAYQVGPDNKISTVGGNGVTVNTGNNTTAFTTDLQKLLFATDRLAPGLADLKANIRTYGLRPGGVGEIGGQQQSLYTGVQMMLKNFNELGALAGPDTVILANQLANPTDFMTLVQSLGGPERTIAQIEQLEGLLTRDAELAQRRLGTVPPTPQSGAPGFTVNGSVGN